MKGICGEHLSAAHRIQHFDKLTIKECQLKCKHNPQCNFFRSSYEDRKCSLWTNVKNGCDGYLGLSKKSSIFCGKGDHNFHFCKCLQTLLHFALIPKKTIHTLLNKL